MRNLARELVSSLAERRTFIALELEQARDISDTRLCWPQHRTLKTDL